MAEWLLKYWPLIAAVGGAALGGWRLVDRVRGTMAEQQRRIDGIALQYKAHEDVCGERYQKIADNHAALVKVTDERADDTKERLGRVEEKMDLMLARLR